MTGLASLSGDGEGLIIGFISQGGRYQKGYGVLRVAFFS